MSEQLLREIQHETIVTANGMGMEETVGKIFQSMRKQVFKEIGKPIIQMEAKEVYFDKVDIQEKKETFLFIFMPRVRTYFAVTARIVLTVKYLEIEKEAVKNG